MTQNPLAITHDVSQALETRRPGSELLLLVDAGSAAWGWAAPFSDHDLRFVYARPFDSYVRITNIDDHIEPVVQGQQTEGWDLQKFMQLALKSNPQTVQWLKMQPVFKRKDVCTILEHLAAKVYSPKNLTYHFCGMAEITLKQRIGEEIVPSKRYLTLVHSLASALWCMNCDQTPPLLLSDLRTTLPVWASNDPLFEELFGHLSWADDVQRLRVRSNTELMLSKNHELEAFAKKAIDEMRTRAKTMRMPRLLTKDEIDETFRAACRMAAEK